MASLTTFSGNILTFLTELCLESYYDTFIEEGYDNINFLSVVPLEDLLEMGMKRGHARRVIAKINSSCVPNSSTPAATGETKSNSDQMRQAPSVYPEEEDIDKTSKGIDLAIYDLSIRNERGALRRALSSGNPDLDPNPNSNLTIEFFNKLVNHGYRVPWFKLIFSYAIDNEHDQISYRFLCRLFRDSIPPPPMYTYFPSPNYPIEFENLMDAIRPTFNTKKNSIFPKLSKPKVKWIFVGENVNGKYFNYNLHQNEFKFNYKHSSVNKNKINFPLSIIGLGSHRTFFRGTFEIDILRTNDCVALKKMTIARWVNNTISGDEGSLCGHSPLRVLDEERCG